MPSEQFHHWISANVHVLKGVAVQTDAPWHDHDHLVLGLVDQGVRVVESRHTRFQIGPGQGFVLPPRLAHRCPQSGGVDYRILCVDAPAPPAALPVCGLITSPSWRVAFDRAFALAVSDRDAVTEALKALTALAVSLSGAAEPPASAEPQAVRRARRNLLADLGGRQTLQSLAGRVGMSPFHLQRLFAQTTGLSPRQQHMLARLRQVRRLLLDDMAISEIAVACGFSDQSHLNRVFARLMGIPPGRYRTQLRMHDRNILDAAVRPPSHP